MNCFICKQKSGEENIMFSVGFGKEFTEKNPGNATKHFSAWLHGNHYYSYICSEECLELFGDFIKYRVINNFWHSVEKKPTNNIKIRWKIGRKKEALRLWTKLQWITLIGFIKSLKKLLTN
jgi:hypothetical protein